MPRYTCRTYSSRKIQRHNVKIRCSFASYRHLVCCNKLKTEYEVFISCNKEAMIFGLILECRIIKLDVIRRLLSRCIISICPLWLLPSRAMRYSKKTCSEKYTKKKVQFETCSFKRNNSTDNYARWWKWNIS